MNPRRLPRGRRAGVSSLTALVVLVLAVLGAVAAVQIHYGHDATVLGHVHAITHWLHTHRFDDVAVLVAGIVLAVLGLVLLLAGLFPPRRRILALAGPNEHTVLAIDRAGLANDLGAVAARVDGVESAKARLAGRRRVRIEARSPMRDRSGLAEAVEEAVTARIDALGPAKRMRVRTRVTSSGS